MKWNTSTKDLWKTAHTVNIQNWKLLCFQNWKLSIAGRWIHKDMQYVHTMWQFSARKRNKLELHKTHEWLSKTPSWVKEVRPKRTSPTAVHTEWSHLFEILEQAKKTTQWKEKGPPKNKTLQYKKVSDQCYLWGGSRWEPGERAWGDFLWHVSALTLTHWSLGYTSLIAQLVKNPPAMQETLVQSLGWEDPLEKGKATHASILAWRIPWTKQSMG